MTDLLPIIDALGGGLSAVVIVALLGVCGALYRQVQSLNEKRIDDQRAMYERSADRERETTAALNAMAAAMREQTLLAAQRGSGDV